MSDTPRTDAHCKEIGGDDGLCYADFARELERELAAANRSADACLQEIDRLRAQLNAAYEPQPERE